MTDPNAKIEYVASRMWYAYCERVSGREWAAKQSWDDADDQTCKLFLGHAIAALSAVEEMKEMDRMVQTHFPENYTGPVA